MDELLIFNEYSINLFDNSIYLDPHNYFEDYDNNLYVNQLITEASTNVTKKNILTKLWNFIKKIFELIRKGLNKLIEFIGHMLGKASKSIMNVIEDCHLKIKQKIHFGNNRYERIKLPKHRLSKINPGDSVDAPINPMKIKFENDNEIVVVILPFNIRINVPVAGHQPSGWLFGEVIHVLDELNGDYKNLDNIQKIIDNMNLMAKKDIDDNTKEKLIKDPKDIHGNIYTKNHTIKSVLKDIIRFKFNIGALREYNKKVQNLMEQISKIDINEFLNKLNTEQQEYSKKNYELINSYVIYFNIISSYLTNINMAINTLTSAMRQIYDIPAEYIGAISDMETLSQFVEKMIKCGFPSKYVMLNSYLIADEKLRGSDKSGNENKPIWGQSRVVFLPEEKDIVHKIAINGFGLNSNTAEEMHWKAFKDAGQESILAPLVWISKNKYCLDMKKAKTFTITQATQYLKEIYKKLREAQNIVNKNRERSIYIGDIHQGNIAKYNDQLVLIDYGL